MARIRIESELTEEEMLQAVGRLGARDLARFVDRVLRLQAQQNAVSLPARESELLLKINEGYPRAWRTRYDALRHKRETDLLTGTEEREFFDLITKREAWQAQRLEALAELARLRKLSLREMMTQLGIEAPGYE